MPRQGLTKKAVVQSAVELIEEKGYASFSMAELAKKLHIKTASLYNHIENMEALYIEAGLYAARQMKAAEEEAIQGKNGFEALFSLAQAYRNFIKEHNELYRVVMDFQRKKNPALEEAVTQISEPIFHVLDSYHLDEAQKIHWQRILRSVMHGFAVHEEAGWFSHSAVSREDSCRIALQCIEDGLRAAGKEIDETND